VKEKMEDLYRSVRKNVEFWDGRLLLMLQREVEFMLLPDVREFSEKFPWSDKEDDSSVSDNNLSAVLSVTTQHAGKKTLKKEETLKKLSSFREKPEKSKVKGKTQFYYLFISFFFD
jgi:hypothetical protein